MTSSSRSSLKSFVLIYSLSYTFPDYTLATMNEEMDLSDDLNDILFLIEDNVFVRWRIDYNFFNQSVYGRLFERGNLRFRDYGGRNLNLPEIKGEPNTKKLQVSGSTFVSL